MEREGGFGWTWDGDAISCTDFEHCVKTRTMWLPEVSKSFTIGLTTFNTRYRHVIVLSGVVMGVAKAMISWAR